MDWDDALPWFVIFLVAPVALAVRSIVVDRRLKARIDALTGKIGMLDHRLLRMDERLRALGERPGTEPQAAPAEAPSPAVEAAPAAEPVAVEVQPVLTAVTTRESPVPAGDAGRRFEQRLAENWL